jgi:hypothetical protein
VRPIAFGDHVAIPQREQGGWRQHTFAEVGGLLDELVLGPVALALISLDA